MPFSFDSALGRYRDASGALVPEAAVRRALDTVLAGSAQTMRDLTTAMMDGRLSLATWQASMLSEIKAAHLVGATLATGGWGQMDQSDFGWTGQRLRTEYSFLKKYAADIVAGRQKMDGTLLARSALYAAAARSTHREQQRRLAKERGIDRERRVLGASDHCGSCLSQASRGWQPLGTLLAIGDSQCRSNCRCHFEFKMAA